MLKTCTSARAPAAMQGNTEHVLSLYGGMETYFRCFFGEAIGRVGVLGRGRGGVQVLEHLGPESAENLYSPAPPAAMQGNTEHVLFLYGVASSEKQ